MYLTVNQCPPAKHVKVNYKIRNPCRGRVTTVKLMDDLKPPVFFEIYVLEGNYNSVY